MESSGLLSSKAGEDIVVDIRNGRTANNLPVLFTRTADLNMVK